MYLELHAQIHVVKKAISFRYLLSTSSPTLDKVVVTVENEKKNISRGIFKYPFPGVAHKISSYLKKENGRMERKNKTPSTVTHPQSP